MIPESFIQDLLVRTDIVELIDSYVHLKKAGANYAACCPFHNEKSPSFTVSPSKQFYHCFGCGAHGTAIGFVMAYQGLDFVEAVHELARRQGMAVPEPVRGTGTAAAPRTLHLAEIMAQAARYYREQLKQSDRAIRYLKGRGLTGEIAARFGLGYAPEGWQNLQAVFPDHATEALQQAGLVIRNEQGRSYDRFRDRIMFPIINPKGEVIAFGGRVMDAGEPKYLNSPETPLFEKGRELFGLPQARQGLRRSNTAIVVEGYMDVVALAQHGIDHAVATLGTATTAIHVQKLLRQVDRIVFCFDGDNAGRKAAWRALENALEALADNKSIGFVFLPPEHDPDSFVRACGQAAFAEKVRTAAPLSDVLLRELAQRCDLTTAEGRSKLIFEAKPLLSRLPTPLLRLQLVKRLAEASGFSQQEVERLCELRSITRAAPVSAPRRKPSLARHLLRLVMQKPAFAHALSPQQLPEGEEQAALRALVEQVHARTGTCAYAVLREQLRGHPAEAMLDAVAGELVGQVLDESEAETEFHDALRQLEKAGQQQRLQALQEKAQQYGVAGLSGEEKRDYLALLARHGKTGVQTAG